MKPGKLRDRRCHTRRGGFSFRSSTESATQAHIYFVGNGDPPRSRALSAPPEARRELPELKSVKGGNPLRGVAWRVVHGAPERNPAFFAPQKSHHFRCAVKNAK